jgi:predicted DNA-binding transcriptional regulator AlpA
MSADAVQLAKLAFLGLSKSERREFLRTFTDTPTPAPAAPGPDRILRRGEVARLLARSDRAIDRLAADGILQKVKLPGRRRCCGFRLSDVLSMIGGQ